MPGERVLTRRELNRALLERQLLLERRPLPAVQAVERLGGLQAQWTPGPYLSLWTRLEHFERELTSALGSRRLVKALLHRGTLHVVAPKHYWAMMSVRRTLTSALWPPSYEAIIPSADIAALSDVVAAELDRRELTFKEVQALLEPHAKDRVRPALLWRRVQGYACVMHVPPSGVWGYGGHGVYTSASGRLAGAPPAPGRALDLLVRAYLGAYGPAAKDDLAQWAGIPRIGEIAQSLARLSLRSFRDERGRALYDLPRAPLPHASTPAPPRLVPRFDNLVLSHADRTRILDDVPPSRIVAKNGLVHATILVDGFVAGTWQLLDGRVVLEPFRRLEAGVRRALAGEAERLEAFVA